MKKSLGKISFVGYGFGGYQGVMMGVSFTLSTEDGSCGDFWGYWMSKRTDDCKWTEEERITFFGKMTMRIAKVMQEAQVKEIHDLLNTPIEVIWNNDCLDSWRVLTEVIK